MAAARVGVSRFLVVPLSLALLALAMSAPLASAKNGGNSANAKICQKGGWQNYTTSDGTPFASEDDCTSYAAQGGTLEAIPTFQSVCESYGGTYQADPFYSNLYNAYLSPTCLWNGADFTPFTSALNATIDGDYCPAGTQLYYLYDVSSDPDYYGCGATA